MCPFMVLVLTVLPKLLLYHPQHERSTTVGTGTAEENKCRGVRSKENLDGGGRRPSPKTIFSMILMTFG